MARNKWLLLALGAMALVLSFCSRGMAEGALSPSEAAKWIKERKELQLIDVRTPAEFAEGHLDNAKLIPLQELEGRMAEIDQAKPVLLYCRSGRRSDSALKMLQNKGYSQAKHLGGGINAWKAAGLPTTK